MELIYPKPSSFLDGSSPELQLTSSNPDVPVFFSGRFTEPRFSADLLLALSHVVGSRFYTPPSMVARLIRESDPIVTCTEELIRWEGFSACCSVYCRVDMEQSALNGALLSPGTTNVDFGPHMTEALTKARTAKTCTLSVGREFVGVKHEYSEATEKLVEVPRRWLQALVEAQHHQHNMVLQQEVGKAGFRQFLQSLPRSGSRKQAFVVPSGKGLRLAFRDYSNAIPLYGWDRLAVLQRLLLQLQRVKVYVNSAGASCWQLSCRQAQFYLLLSPKPWRGFSGEGQALFDLSGDRSHNMENSVLDEIAWNSASTHGVLKSALGVDGGQLQSALSCLSATGRIGFDLERQGYFRRDLPFPWDDFEKFHPRLKAARELLNAVRFENGAAWVKSQDVEYRIDWAEGVARCTCPWYLTHGTSRGPCKHILAAQWS